jgi:hypothetical protein
VVGDDPSTTAPLDPAFWNATQEELSAQGLRVLALCRCCDDDDDVAVGRLAAA